MVKDLEAHSRGFHHYTKCLVICYPQKKYAVQEYKALKLTFKVCMCITCTNIVMMYTVYVLYLYCVTCVRYTECM